MINPFRGYIKIKDKKPCQKFGNGEPLLTLAEADKLSDYAGILNGDFIVKDVDDTAEAEAIYNIVQALNLNCRVYKTTRGLHFMFLNSEYCTKGGTGETDAYGIKYDIRMGQNMYIVLKTKGKLRSIIRDFDETRPIDVFPKAFSSVAGAQKMLGMSDGSGRNGALFKHSALLLRHGFTPTEVRDILYRINDFIFAEPLSEEEMKQITRKEAIENYIARSTAAEDFGNQLKPKEQTDFAIAKLFAHEYGGEIRYNPAIGWLVWNGRKWEASPLAIKERYMEFMKKVLQCAKNEITQAYANTGTDVAVSGRTRAEDENENAIKDAIANYKFINRMCTNNKMVAVLNCVDSLLKIDVRDLDQDPFELNTPRGIINLKTGLVGIHRANAYCTKMAKASPSNEGMDLWEECLDSVTQGDAEFKDYLQAIAGGMLIGKVYAESMFIAYGDGANGKSTVFNAIYEVLGDYSGKIPAESLTTRAKNAKVDLAELLGKRFVLASETEEGQRLSTSMLKQIASADEIVGEKKYHDPFVFVPTHTLVLYTNHLPRVGSNDKGTWRRLIVLPFNAVIANPQRDFGEKLMKRSAGAILQWAIEGAKKFIDNNFQLPHCKVVEEANGEYRDANDWCSTFVEECCIVGDAEKVLGGVLYKAYRAWAVETGEYVRCNRDFADTMHRAGYKTKRTNKGTEWLGLSLDANRPEALRSAEEDFLR